MREEKNDPIPGHRINKGDPAALEKVQQNSSNQHKERGDHIACIMQENSLQVEILLFLLFGLLMGRE